MNIQEIETTVKGDYEIRYFARYNSKDQSIEVGASRHRSCGRLLGPVDNWNFAADHDTPVSDQLQDSLNSAISETKIAGWMTLSDTSDPQI